MTLKPSPGEPSLRISPLSCLGLRPSIGEHSALRPVHLEDCYAAAHNTAKRDVDLWWPEIVAVAERLRKTGYLDGEECVRLIESAMNGGEQTMPSTKGQCPKRAVLYARVSTDEQARSGYSLAQQIEAMRAYAAREGYEVHEEVSDLGQSGASLERPGIDRV